MLNLPFTDLKTRVNKKGSSEIFDEFRKKYVSLSPEEKVRQQFIHYLINEKKFPKSLIAIEKGLILNNLQKRFDAVVYNNMGKPIVLLEFKSPDIKITQAVFEQISAYNIKLQVNYLIVSNGLNHYCCKIDYENAEIKFLNDIPFYKDLSF